MKNSLSLIRFFKQYPSESKAEQYFIRLRWGRHIICPFCGSIHIAEKKDRKPMPYRCMDCRKHFSVRTGTILSESKLPLQKWLLAIYILTNSHKGISSVQLAEHLGVTQKTAWFLGHRIRQAWMQGSKKLFGVVEVDETYIGGLEKNKHNSKKLKAGRGAVGKTPVVGAKSRNGNVKAFVVKETTAETLTRVITDNVDRTAELYTDEHRGYNEADGLYSHSVVNHSVKEFVRNQAHTNGIESFWALLKRGYYGIYHKWSVKHLQRYINEFVNRANARETDMEARISETFARGMNTRLSYKELIAE